MSYRLRRFQPPTRPVSAFLIACLLALVIAVPPARAATDTFTAPGPGAWIAPAGVTSIAVECWGGGGGGGDDANSSPGGAGGGGGGAYARVNSFAVIPGNSFSFVVGAGGGAAANGENSSFNATTCVAAGGAAGTSSNSGAGGAGGTASTPTTGDVTFAGGTGSNGIAPVGGAAGGGGGGSAGTSSNGTSVIGSSAGAALVVGGGPGGNGGTNVNGSAPASGPGGGGGGGGFSTSLGARTGGPGFAGQIRITYKLTPALSVTNSPVTYDGTPQPATVIGSVPGTVSTILYAGSPTVPTSAGTYVITADFTPDDTATYNSLSGAAAGTFVINKAATTTTVTCTAGPFPYTGAPIAPCSATVTGPGGLNQPVAVTYADNVNAGTATASASYAGSADYLPSTDSETFTVAKAATTTTVTCPVGPFPYTGAPVEPCTATVTGPGGLNQPVAVTYADNVNAGTATATANYAGSANHLTSSDSETFTVAKAATITTVTCSAGPFSYTGAAITPCSATVTGPGGLNQPAAVTYADNVNAGTATASASYAESVNHLASSDSETFTIAKAATTTTVTCTAGPFSYTGAPITPCTAAVTGPGGLNQVLTVTYADNVNAGTATASASYAGSANHLASSDAKTFTIFAAGTPTLSVTNSPVTYNGTPQTATVVASVPGTVSNIRYNGSATVPANAGTYAITADFVPDDTANYDSLSGAAAGSFVIQKAATITTVTCSAGPFTYTGAGIEPCTAAVTGPGGLNQAVAVTYTGNVNAGSATASASYAGSANHLPSSDAETFTIDKATPTLSVSNSPAAYDGTPKTATVVGSVPGTVSAVLYNGSATAPTDAGTYAITADFAPDDTTNYNNLSGAAAGNFVIEKAGTPTLTVTNSPVTYNGSPQAAVVVSSVAGTVSAIRYNGSTSVPTDAGSYVITADFTPDDTANYDSLTAASAGALVIAKAATTTAVTCSTGPFTPTGAPITPCSAAVTGPGGLNQVLAVTYAGNVNAGTATASASYAGSANYLPSSDAETFIIGQSTTINLHLPYVSR